MKNKKISTEELLFAKHILASDCDTHFSTLQRLSNDENELIRKAVRSNPNFERSFKSYLIGGVECQK